jgi:molybdopterin-guanine dinucleotide biosynthesis protein B
MKRPAPPIVCIVGRKNSGKTEFTVALAAEFKRRGYRVMTAKHGHGFELDHPGKDSWRHRHEGGALRTVMAGPSDFAVLGRWPDEELPLVDLVERFLSDADLVLAEGFKASPFPKIEVFRTEAGGVPWTGSETEMAGTILALVSDGPVPAVPVPVFSLQDPGHLEDFADFLEGRFLEGKGGDG